MKTSGHLAFQPFLLPAITMILIGIAACRKDDGPVWERLRGSYTGNVTCISLVFGETADTSYSTATVTIDSISPDLLVIKDRLFKYYGQASENNGADTLLYQFVYSHYSGFATIDIANKHFMLKEVDSPPYGITTCTGNYDKQ